ncbi:hypothetical protein PIB30_064354 [Stylosanthes scabra]|uniref:Uncharacterized protein n=1 Tax=Stylosanthes scabra TaxID=79078 RepID=A0ABU6SMW2_9FABA|nr:hypothetical protein [Stylosanthes scabra]
MNTASQPLPYNDLDDMKLMTFTFGLGDEQRDEIIIVEVGKDVKVEASLEFKELKEIKESHWMWDKCKKKSKGTHEVEVEKKATKPKASNVVIKDSRKLELNNSTNNPITKENDCTLKLHNNKPHNNKEMEAYLAEDTSKWN